MSTTEDEMPPPLQKQELSDYDRMTPESQAAHDRFMAAAGWLEKLGAEALEALAEAQACGVDVRQLDADVIQTRLIEQIPYALKFRAGQLLPARVGRLVLRLKPATIEAVGEDK